MPLRCQDLKGVKGTRCGFKEHSAMPCHLKLQEGRGAVEEDNIQALTREERAQDNF
jgi:hypothetical protein